MICPQCRAEYPTGFVRCVDCDLALVDAPDLAMQEGRHEPVEVFATKDLSLIPVLRSLLDGAEIPYEIRGDQSFSLQPAFDILTGREKTPIQILVPANLAEEARALLEIPDPSSALDS